jgi:hypothetical protein
MPLALVPLYSLFLQPWEVMVVTGGLATGPCYADGWTTPRKQNKESRRKSVGLTEILSQIDREIALLQQARALLAGSAAKAKKTAVSAAKPAKKKRRLSPEGRRRIAEAVKRRWAEQKKAASK